MDKFERGKRIETGVYDDVWIHGDDGVELIPLTAQERKATYDRMIKIMRDHDWYSFPFTEEECKEIIDNYHSDDEAFQLNICYFIHRYQVFMMKLIVGILRQL